MHSLNVVRVANIISIIHNILTSGVFLSDQILRSTFCTHEGPGGDAAAQTVLDGAVGLDGVEHVAVHLVLGAWGWHGGFTGAKGGGGCCVSQTPPPPPLKSEGGSRAPLLLELLLTRKRRVENAERVDGGGDGEVG